MSVPTSLPEAKGSPIGTAPAAAADQNAARAGFEACVCDAGARAPRDGTGAPGALSDSAAEGPVDEATFQERMFEGFTGGVDEATHQRLSKWLPDVLNGGKEDLKEAIKGLSKEDAADLNALAETLDLDGNFAKVKDRKGFAAKVVEAVGHKSNQENLEALKRTYGEHALKASTPQLAPAASYDTGSTIEAARAQVFDQFTEGLDEEARARLETWLPEAFENPKDPNDLNKTDSKDLKALAEAQGLEGKNLYDQLKRAYKRDVTLATAGTLPTVADLMLVKDHGNAKLDKLAAEIGLGDGDLKKVLAEYEQSEFMALDSWLPAALAGQGEMPSGDPEAMALLQRFAERMGYEGDAPATPEQAMDFLERSGVVEEALHPGRTDENRAHLLFSDTFLENTLKYGARNNALTQEMLLDAAGVAEMLLGPDDGTDAPRELQIAGLQAAILHRTDQTLVRPQEVMAANGYIAKGETLAEQKTRLVESLLAFHVREEIGTPPMTAQQWATSYEEVHPELLDELGGRVFNSPTGEKMQIITQHLGVPGDHSFMIDKKRKIKIENDDLGNVENFDMKKKKKKWYKKVLDIAVPVIGAVLTLTGVGAGVGAAINVAYGAYKGAEAIKNGDLMGGLLNIAGSFAGGATTAFSGAAAQTAAAVSRGINIASQGLQTFRAIDSGDILGAVTGGLGALSTYTGQTRYQTTANTINVGRSIDRGDYLAAGAGATGIASDITRPPDGSSIAYHNDTSLAFNTLSNGLSVAHGIKHDDYAGIGNALANGVRNVGQYRLDQQAIEDAKIKAAALDAPGDLFGGGDTLPTFEDVKKSRVELNRSAEELDRDLAAIDREIRENPNPAANGGLIERRAALQQERDVIGIRQEAIRAQTHALAADDAYLDESNLGAESHLERLSEADLRVSGFKTDLLRDDESGYFAAVYKDKVTGKIIVANRGTEGAFNPEGNKDWGSNFSQGTGNLDPQYMQALSVALEAKFVFGDNIDFTGHSLGGGLASIQIAATGLDGTTFNSSGLHPEIMEDLDFTSAEAESLIKAYYVKSEPLNSLQDHTNFGPIDLIPDARGERVTLPTLNSDGEPVGLFDRFKGAIDLHGIGAARQSLNEYFYQAELAAWAGGR